MKKCIFVAKNVKKMSFRELIVNVIQPFLVRNLKHILLLFVIHR
jgi:hypothetical protein